jgi:hypothetical protein
MDDGGRTRTALILLDFFRHRIRHENDENRTRKLLRLLAIPAGLEPATRGVEIRYSNFVQDSATDDPSDGEKFSIPLDGAESVTVPRRLYSWSRWTVGCLHGLVGQIRRGSNRLNAGLRVVGEGHRTFRFGSARNISAL